MIDVEILLAPLAIAGFVAGVVFAVIAGRFRRDAAGNVAMTALGSGIALAALAWANEIGGGALFVAATMGLGATLWAIGNERATNRRTIIR